VAIDLVVHVERREGRRVVGGMGSLGVRSDQLTVVSE
jgi:hypothetical protein